MRSRERLIEVIETLNYSAAKINVIDVAHLKGAASALKVTPNAALTFSLNFELPRIAANTSSPHVAELAAELLHYFKPYVEQPVISERLL